MRYNASISRRGRCRVDKRIPRDLLYLAPLVPYPPHDGDRRRALALLQALARRRRVHLVCFTRTPAEAQGVDGLRTWCASTTVVRLPQTAVIGNSLRACLGPLPLNVAAFASRAMAREVSRVVTERGIGVVHAYRLRMAPYALRILGVRRVLDLTDSMGCYFQERKSASLPWWRRAYAAREADRLSVFEPATAGRFDACLISSPRDRVWLTARGAPETLTVVSNGVDPEAFRPAPRLTAAPVMLFVGNLAYPPNAEGLAEFCRTTFPLIKRALPAARLLAVGGWRGGRSEGARRFPGAELAGRVTDLDAYWASCRVSICPLNLAAGRQFKVLESMAAGLPAVTTTRVAENLEALPGRHLLTGDTPEEFSRQVVRLCREDNTAAALREAARDFVVSRYTWEEALRPMLEVYDRLEADPGEET